MAKTKAVTKGKKNIEAEDDKRTMFRYADKAHYDLVMKAVEASKLPSINAWLVQATLKQARAELKT